MRWLSSYHRITYIEVKELKPMEEMKKALEEAVVAHANNSRGVSANSVNVSLEAMHHSQAALNCVQAYCVLVEIGLRQQE